VRDLANFTVLDLQQCITMCAEYNKGISGIVNSGGFLDYCRAVTLTLRPWNYCWLNNDTGTNNTSSSGDAGYISASLES
jgi:hypothetical protein